jgi:hypothetical protein
MDAAGNPYVNPEGSGEYKTMIKTLQRYAQEILNAGGFNIAATNYKGIELTHHESADIHEKIDKKILYAEFLATILYYTRRPVTDMFNNGARTENYSWLDINREFELYCERMIEDNLRGRIDIFSQPWY